MQWKLALVTVFALLLVACEESGEVNVGGAEARGEIQVEERDVFGAARDACRSLPLRDIADEVGVEVRDEEALAERFAEPWPADLEETVKDGCLQGLQESAESGSPQGN